MSNKNHNIDETKPQNELSDPSLDDANLENDSNDSVWELLDQAPKQQAGDFFSRNVMREIRLSDQASSSPASVPFWKRLFQSSSLPFVGIAGATAALVIGIAVYNNTPDKYPEGFVTKQKPIEQTPVNVADSAPNTYEFNIVDILGIEDIDTTDSEDSLSDAMLVAAVDDPTMFIHYELDQF